MCDSVRQKCGHTKVPMSQNVPAPMHYTEQCSRFYTTYIRTSGSAGQLSTQTISVFIIFVSHSILNSQFFFVKLSVCKQFLQIILRTMMLGNQVWAINKTAFRNVNWVLFEYFHILIITKKKRDKRPFKICFK